MSKFASDEVVAKRIEVCSACDKNKFGLCIGCGCVIKLKTAKKKSACPILKWLSVDT